MAKDNKFRGAVYNQPKLSAADELDDALNQVAAPADQAAQDPEPTEEQAAAEQEQTTESLSTEDLPEVLNVTRDPVTAGIIVEVGELRTAKDEPIGRGDLKSVVFVDPISIVTQPDQKAQARIMKSVERDLVSYMEAVHPKQAVNDEVGGAWQGSLFQTLKRILGNPDPEAFKTEWNTLLGFFHKHHDEMFNENFMFRFQSTWKGSVKDYTTFRHLVYLIIRTANPQTRQKEIREIVLERITQGLDTQSATNLVNFYA